MTELILKGKKRDKLGTGAAKALRKENQIPAVIYGFNKTYTISLVYKEFLKEYHESNLLSRLVTIVFGEVSLKSIVKDIQIDPVSDYPIHVDFQIIKDDIPIKTRVKIKVINQDKSPGIKKGGIPNLITKYLYLSCMPNNIPKCIEVDIAGYEIGEGVCIDNLKLPDGADIIDYSNLTILTITGRVEEKEEQDEEDLNKNTTEEKDKKE